MELKYKQQAKLRVNIWRSNRTFMELKFPAYYERNIRGVVLIAPLWN